jgi:ATP diphosphatase
MKEIHELIRIMKDLRDPETGCPWDIKQSFSSIAPYTVEEAYEVADAIERDDIDGLKSELGDLLFQVIFHSQIADEQGKFDFADVVQSINDKLIRRHPHVFSDEQVESHEHLAERWEQHKEAERESKQENEGVLSGVASSLPALQWSQKLQKRAARTGFDWPDIEPVFEKLDEEVGELREELRHEDNQARILDEYGDVLFVCANLGMHLNVNAEEAMRYANRKFISRFNTMERMMQEDGVSFDNLSLQEMETYWQKAKKELRKS